MCFSCNMGTSMSCAFAKYAPKVWNSLPVSVLWSTGISTKHYQAGMELWFLSYYGL